MAGGIDWFRWHHGSVTDPKFQLVAKRVGCSRAEVIAAWAFLLEEASMAKERGNPGKPDFEAMDCSLGVDDGRSQAIYSAMQDRSLIADDGSIAAWDKRQVKRERDGESSTRRVQEHRERKRHETQNETKKRYETPGRDTQHQEAQAEHHGTPREEERREEVNLKPLSVASDIPSTPPEGTAAGRICARLRKAGVASVNPSHPKLRSLIAAGMSESELADIAAEPASAGKGFAWVLATAEGRRRDAANAGQLPQARASPSAIRDAERAEVARVLMGRGGQTSGIERDITGEAERIA